MTFRALNGLSLFLCVLIVTGCATSAPRAPERLDRFIEGKTCTQIEQGTASYYGDKFHGRKTANGERFNQNELTAAHKTLPFGTRLLVENKDNGKEVMVRVNDRGPFIKGRVIDLSKAAGREIDMIGPGVVPVSVYRCD